MPAPQSAQDRTYLCAVMLREWAAREGVVLDAIDLVGSDLLWAGAIAAPTVRIASMTVAGS